MVSKREAAEKATVECTYCGRAATHVTTYACAVASRSGRPVCPVCKCPDCVPLKENTK
jgi:hypothetical protein